MRMEPLRTPHLMSQPSGRMRAHLAEPAVPTASRSVGWSPGPTAHGGVECRLTLLCLAEGHRPDAPRRRCLRSGVESQSQSQRIRRFLWAPRRSQEYSWCV
jgi:hypothetical protein